MTNTNIKNTITKQVSKTKVALCDCEAIHLDKVEKLMDIMPEEQEFRLIAEFFKVFADNTRSKILWALDEEELCVCDIAALLNMSKSAVSHHLAYLRKSRLVNYRREGKVVYYSLADDHIKQIFEAGREHINE